MTDLTFRKAEEADAELILKFIKDLTDYEKMLNEVVATEELLKEWIFDKKKAEVIFPMADGNEVGFALFFHNFSTFLGRAGIYLEDLYIKQLSIPSLRCPQSSLLQVLHPAACYSSSLRNCKNTRFPL